MEYMLLALAVAGLIWWLVSRRKQDVEPLPPNEVDLLEQHVPYYQSLPADRKPVFAGRVSQFLADVRIEGVDTTVDDLDKVLVASSAIIPIFAFEGWAYPNLSTVLLYPNSFNEAYETKGADRMIMGQVGEGGALQSTMVLSKPALRAGFDNKTSQENTGIHEFVHLLDKVDGAIDGAPTYLVPKDCLKPWLRLMHKSIQDIKANQSDINPYGITNEAEFFAVVSEYFFEQPERLQTRHPELFSMLDTIFRQDPASPEKGVEDPASAA